MHISSNAKRALFVVILGGAIGASCALPGYETDSGLSGSSSSSSGGISSSGGGKDNVGGAGGKGETGGAGGQGGGLAEGIQKVLCKDFYDVKGAADNDCSGYVVSAETPGATESCPFAQETIGQQCCVIDLNCVHDPVAGKTVWKQSQKAPVCGVTSPNCPLGCKLPPDAKTCPGIVPTGVNSATCSCFNANPEAPAGALPGPLPICVYEPDVCISNPGSTHPVLMCKEAAAGGPVGTWEVVTPFCCAKDPISGKKVCGDGSMKECLPTPSFNAGGPYPICPLQ